MLALFEIAAHDAAVREILKRLVGNGALEISALQTARDIIARRPETPDAAYLFLAAMFISLKTGAAALELDAQGAYGAALLRDGVRYDRRREEMDGANAGACEAIDAMWPVACSAVAHLEGDIVRRDSPSGGAAGKWYFAVHYNAAKALEAWARARLGANASAFGAIAEDSLARAIAYSRAAFTVSEGQRDAVRAALSRRLVVITGGPGTGKTTIVCSILRALLAQGSLTPREIALAAPTGRAAQRMAEAIKAQCSLAGEDELPAGTRAALSTLVSTTIHSLLGGRAPRWRHDSSNPLSIKLIVIDEFSMVDLLLMRDLVAALPANCRVVLLGDRDQLPPVQTGAVLGDLLDLRNSVEGACGAFVELAVSHRFKGSLAKAVEGFRREDASGILDDSARLGDDWARAVASPSTLDSCLFYPQPFAPDAPFSRKAAALDAFLRDWAALHGLAKGGALAKQAEKLAAGAAESEMTPEAKALFDVLDSSRILTVVRNGLYGASRINALLPPSLKLDEPGIPVIIVENAPSIGLFNGDTGVTIRETSGGIAVLFPRGTRMIACPAAFLPAHDFAYAITVHKSQGSEFGDVLAILPDSPGHPLVTRKLVYTAITRARRRSVVYATEEALRMAAVSARHA